MNDLTPAQAAWGQFYHCLHLEVQKLEKLAAQKNTSSVSPAKTITEEVSNQSQLIKASVKSDSNHS